MKFFFSLFLLIVVMICSSSYASGINLTLPLNVDWRQIRYDKLDNADTYIFKNGQATIRVTVRFQEFTLDLLQSERKNLMDGGLEVLSLDPRLLFEMDNIQYRGVDKWELMPDLYVFGAILWGHGLKVDTLLTYKYLKLPKDSQLNEKCFNTLVSSIASQIAALNKQKLEVLPKIRINPKSMGSDSKSGVRVNLK